MRLLVLFFALFATPALALETVPEDLRGDWGGPGQCEAQRQAGPEAVVDSPLDAPYRFKHQWLNRWHFSCLVQRIDPLSTDGHYRMHLLCGEDARERRWSVDVLRDGDTLNMSWVAIEEDQFGERPWETGPFNRCPAPAS